MRPSSACATRHKKLQEETSPPAQETQRSSRHDEIAELVRDFDRMAAQIEKLMCAQKKLISDVSHEFRSPLTRINLAAELIRNVNSPAVKTAVARIQQETERLNGMISNLLTLSKIDAGESLADETIDVAEMLRTIVADTDFEARDHNCRVALHGAQDCLTVGSSDLLRSAVENVIRNAIRYTAQQTKSKFASDVKQATPLPKATISVRDHGPGVPESSLEELFRPFFRLDESRERSTGGVGLGLAIAQRAVRASWWRNQGSELCRTRSCSDHQLPCRQFCPPVASHVVIRIRGACFSAHVVR